MNRDQIRGASRHLKGRAQTALGGLTGDPARQVRGAVNQVAGGAQYAYGRARDRAEDLAEDLVGLRRLLAVVLLLLHSACDLLVARLGGSLSPRDLRQHLRGVGILKNDPF